MKKKPTKVDQIISQDSHSLGSLLQRVRWLESLTHDIKNHLHKEFSTHVTASSVQQDKLIMYVDNAAWAMKLRFHNPSLKKHFSTHPQLRHYKTIKIKINPLNGLPQRTT